MDLGRFFVDQVVVHDIPKRLANGSGDQPVLSDIPSPLTPDLRNFFRERIVRSLGNTYAFEVVPEPGNASPVPEQTVNLIGDATKLVDASKAIALHLHGTQTGVNPSGLVVVCRGVVDGLDCCAILKLEREDAIRVQAVQADGKQTFDVAYLRDLMLGQNTRVFKASLFATSDGAVSGLQGLVSDDQSAIGDAGGGVAGFFLQRFLGCKLKDAPDVATREFFEATQSWINTLSDPVARGRYEVALIASMNAQAKYVTPKTFADTNIDQADRKSLREHLGAAGVPQSRFLKDTRLIASKLKQMSISFSSSLRVSGKPEDIDQHVRVNSPGTGAAPVEIHDEVRDFRGGGR